MKYKEFLEYMETHLDGYQTFRRKAHQFQAERNARRKKGARWSDEKVDKAVDDMWKQSMEGLYEKIKGDVKSDSSFAWESFIEKNDILEAVNEGISEMDFLESGA